MKKKRARTKTFHSKQASPLRAERLDSAGGRITRTRLPHDSLPALS